jgi:cytochrome c oxidase subunit 2
VSAISHTPSHLLTRCGHVGVVAACLLCACSGQQSALDVRGPAAARIADLWWLMLGVAAAVYLVVAALLVVLLLRRRRGEVAPEASGVAGVAGEPGVPGAPDAAERRGAAWVVVGGAVLPALILTAVFAVTLRTLSALGVPPGADLTIRVAGRQFWWEVTYPDGGAVVTANEIHIPTGRRVRLELTSPDVIHSLWVPNLQGKTDHIPGKTTVMWLQADRPGVSRGQCAEYCGIQHTHMALLVVAQPPAEFENWLAAQRRPAVAPTDSLGRQGRDVFIALGCAYCHAVRGERTVGLLGPDLTHFAGRRTIAAATLPNTRENLAAWVVDPQRVKPGSKMPATPLAPEQLNALLSYLESLR